MKNKKLIGASLILTALLVVSGIIVKSEIYWSVIDIAVILVCTGAGLFLLKNNKAASTN